MSQKKRMLERKRREEALKKAERNQAIGQTEVLKPSFLWQRHLALPDGLVPQK